MASINWPSALSDVLVSNATVSEPGLAGWWSMNTVSEYPTGTATYIQTEWATTDGWAANGGSCTVSMSGGNLIAVGTGTRADISIIKTIADTHGKTVKAKIAYDADIVSLEYFNGSVPVVTIPVRNGNYYYFNLVPSMTPTSFGSLTLYVRYASAAVAGTKTVNFDWIYIGDGSYAANSLLDNSGNGNHGQIFGATPTEGVSGNGLILDGTNDRLTYPTVRSLAKSVAIWVKFTSNAADLRIVQENFGAGTGALFLVGAASQKITFSWRQTAGASDSMTTASNYNNDIWHHIVATHNGTTASLYVDGILTNSKASAYYDIAPDAQGFIGSNSILSIFFPGTIDEPRIYNHALSAAEVLYLYQNPSPYAALPNAPLQDGYSETKQNGVIRSSVDAGAPKMRQRFTAVTRQYNVSFALTSNMAQILDYFYYTTTSQGVALFNWTDPRTGASVEARFIEPPVHRPNGPEYVTSCTLEVLP